jgi:DNA modification methylase
VSPYYADDLVTLYQGDARAVLRELPDASVNCCVTSPPYWGLRDYGGAPQIWGGADDCDHAFGINGSRHTGAACSKCGAWRGSYGLEPTPAMYVEHTVEIFREVRRVLRDDGTLWINLGDSYASQGGAKTEASYLSAGTGNSSSRELQPGKRIAPNGFKPKDLIGIPWMVAFALRADGWYLRSDIIWHKLACMPESVTDRPTRAHEYLFLLSKSERYFYDHEEIKEPVAESTIERINQDLDGGETRNRRSVWTLPPAQFSGAHFATFPPKLIEPCILAGCPGPGKRCDCDEIIYTPTGNGDGRDDPSMLTGRAGFNRPRRDDEGRRPITRREQRDYAQQLRESPNRAEMASEASTAFEHYIRTDDSGARPIPPDLLELWKSRGWLREPALCTHPHEPVGIVLDPFFGAGTTGLVCQQQHVRCVGIELNPEYCAIAKARLSQSVLPFTAKEPA